MLFSLGGENSRRRPIPPEQRTTYEYFAHTTVALMLKLHGKQFYSNCCLVKSRSAFVGLVLGYLEHFALSIMYFYERDERKHSDMTYILF